MAIAPKPLLLWTGRQLRGSFRVAMTRHSAMASDPESNFVAHLMQSD